jgi:hypothetical protein
MKMSNTQAVIIALMPKAAESLENSANELSCLVWYKKTKEIKRARNALYVSTAVTIIATIGRFFNQSSSIKQYTCTITAVLGASLAVLNANKLYDATLFVQNVVNLGTRPK